jgi:large subunit ribosomal protein L31
MAKKGIHPDYHVVTIQMTDGTTYESRSTYGKAGDTIQLDVDPKTHPAWVGGVTLRQTGRLEGFTKRFGGIASINKAPTGAASEKKEEKKDESAA